MNAKTVVLGIVAVAALPTITATTVPAATRHHHYRHHHHGYGAYAQYRGHRPTGPSNLNFELGAGWNNGSASHPQYGRPDNY